MMLEPIDRLCQHSLDNNDLSCRLAQSSRQMKFCNWIDQNQKAVTDDNVAIVGLRGRAIPFHDLVICLEKIGGYIA